ncbi:Tbingi protein, partial [Trypanosoma conorhini]
RTRLSNVAVARWKERCSRPEPAEAASCSLARAVYAPRPASLPVAAADGQPTATKERAGTLARVCAATSEFSLGSLTLHRGRCVSGVRRGLVRFTARPCTNRPSPPARNSRPRSTGASATVALRLPGKWALQLSHSSSLGSRANDSAAVRPVALTSCPRKLVERIVARRIRGTVEAQLPPQQAGFRPGRSTLDPLARLLARTFHCGKRGKVGAVLVGHAGAFGSVYRGRILHAPARTRWRRA